MPCPWPAMLREGEAAGAGQAGQAGGGCQPPGSACCWVTPHGCCSHRSSVYQGEGSSTGGMVWGTPKWDGGGCGTHLWPPYGKWG